ncbi:MAG: hypothetical protein JXR51_01325 [Bacteroidales bacterium]|nr:hypothetical protein [Bacteroidales bacterium]MBN2755785.1 hypothetical protein [Bacteroidales bacterium]
MARTIVISISIILIHINSFSIDFKKIEEHVKNTPKAVTKSVNELSKYLVSPFKNDDEKFASIYFWVAKNISYSVEMKNANITYNVNKELVDYVIKNKKGVCQHYSELFNELSNLAGLESFLILGYGKERGKVMDLAHAWNAIRINKNWYFIDATWGAGYIQNNKFKKEFDLKYFMVKPEEFIKDHISFDPMWQLIDKPLKYEEFNSGKSSNIKSKKFDFNDTIKNYFLMDKKNQLISTIRRMNENGQKNKLVNDKLKSENEHLNYLNQKTEVDKINDAVSHYNKAVDKFNNFNSLLNKKNAGKKISYSELETEIKSSENEANAAKNIYLGVNSSDKSINSTKNQSLKQIEKMLNLIEKQKAVIKKYK